MDRREASDNAPSESGGGGKKNDLLMRKARSVIDAVIALNKLGSDDEDSSRPSSPKEFGRSEYDGQARRKGDNDRGASSSSPAVKMEGLSGMKPGIRKDLLDAELSNGKVPAEGGGGSGSGLSPENTLYWLSENPSPEDFNGMTFPQKMHHVLKGDKHSDIISWLPSGRSFVVRDQKRFASDVIPKYFLKHIAYTSFTRRLARWGWQNIAKGTYFNKDFNRENPGQCLLMTYNSAVSNKPSEQGGGSAKKNARSAHDMSGGDNSKVFSAMQGNKRPNLGTSLSDTGSQLQQVLPSHASTHQQPSGAGVDAQQVAQVHSAPGNMHPSQSMPFQAQLSMFHPNLPVMSNSGDIFTSYANNNAGHLSVLSQQQQHQHQPQPQPVQGNPSMQAGAPGVHAGFSSALDSSANSNAGMQLQQPHYTYPAGHLTGSAPSGNGQPQGATNGNDTNHLPVHLRESKPSPMTSNLTGAQAELSQKRLEMEQLQQRVAFEQQMQMHQVFFNSQNQQHMMSTPQFLQPQHHQHQQPHQHSHQQPQNQQIVGQAQVHGGGTMQPPPFQAPSSASNDIAANPACSVGATGDEAARHAGTQQLHQVPSNHAIAPGSASANSNQGVMSISMHQTSSAGDQHSQQGQGQMSDNPGHMFFRNAAA